MGLEKIDMFKKAKGWTNEDLASASGIPKTTIDKITSGQTKDPKLETVKAIVRSLGRTLNDLDDRPSTEGTFSPQERAHIAKYVNLDDHGKRVVDIVLDEEADRVKKERAKTKEVIIYRFAEKKKETKNARIMPVHRSPSAAGSPHYATSEYDRIDVSAYDVPRNADFGIRIKGDSMQPTIMDGSIVWVRQQPTIEHNEIGVFMFDEEEESVCKRVRKDAAGRIVELCSDNPDCPSVDEDRVLRARCVGKVVGVLDPEAVGDE